MAAPPAAVFESASDLPLVRDQPEHVEATPAAPVAEAQQPHRAPQLPRISLELPPDSGLELVETTHTAAPQEDAIEAQRPRRVRPPRAAIADEPLQMVETVHKDSTPPAGE